MEKSKYFLKFEHITTEDVQKEFLSLLFGICSISIGLIIGLSFDRCTENSNDNFQMKNIKNAMRQEAKINDSIADLYMKYGQDSIDDIKSEFSFAIAAETCKSDIWIKKAKPNEMIQLTQYISLIKKVNEFKAEDREYKKEILKTKNSYYSDEYRKRFIKAFKATINNLEKSIDTIQSSKNFR